VTTATRTELLKIRTTRLVLGVFGVAAGLTILGAVISAVRAGGTGSNAIPSLSTETGLRTIVSFTGFGLLMALILGITVASGEYRHRHRHLSRRAKPRPRADRQGDRGRHRRSPPRPRHLRDRDRHRSRLRDR
jgi:hypothetical protein